MHWYRLAAKAADASDASDDLDTRVWVCGRAAIALGYEGAALPVADVFADQAIALSDRPSLGLLNAIFGKAHAAALRDDHTTARRLLAVNGRVFDRAGFHEQTSDSAVPHWRVNVFASLLLPGSATRPPPSPPRTPPARSSPRACPASSPTWKCTAG